jgi:hypothetical protein
MDIPTIDFTDSAIADYLRHGIIHVRQNAQDPEPINGYRVDLSPLSEARPSHYWLRQTPGTPELTIASKKVKENNKPKSPIKLENAVALVVSFTRCHPTKDYENVTVEQIRA